MAMVYKLGYNIPKKEINKRVFEYPKLVAQIQALTADKDEQAGRLMLLNDGIKQVIKWLTPHPSDGSRAVEKARLHLITLIGGKEDDK